MTGPIRNQAPPYAGVADLVHPDDLPVPTLPAPPEQGRIDVSGDVDEWEAWEAQQPSEGEAVRGGTREPLGHRVTRRFFTLCEHPRTRDRTMRMLRSGADSAVGGRLLVAFLSRGVFRPVLRSRRIDHASARVELACAQLGGVAVLRYVTRMEPVASMAVEELVAMVGPSVEATLHAPFRDAAGVGGQRRRGAMRRR